jgi:uncharacterized membrane protein
MSANLKIVLSASVMLASFTATATDFDLVRFGKPAGASTATARDLNNLGQLAVAVSVTVNRTTTRDEAYIWQSNAGFTRLLPLAGNPNASPWIINDQGTVGGVARGAGSVTRAVIWSQGSSGYEAAFDLNSLLPVDSGWSLTGVGGISDDGSFVCVMGAHTPSGYYGAVMLQVSSPPWTLISLTPLGSLGPKAPDESDSEIGAINRFGQACGYAATGQVDANGWPSAHAFVWDYANGMSDLLPNEGTSRAMSINDSGDIVGHYRSPGSGATRALFWQGSVAFHAGTLGTSALSRSALSSINNGGTAVGWSDTGSVLTQQRAVIWDATSGLQLLNPMVKNSTLVLREAKAVNDQRQIIAVANISKSAVETVLLTPRP